MGAERIRELIEMRGRTDKPMNAILWVIISIITLGLGYAIIVYRLLKSRNEHVKRDGLLMEAVVEFLDREGKEKNIDLGSELASLRNIREKHSVLEASRNPIIWPLLSIITLGLILFYAYYILTKDIMQHDELNREYIHAMNEALIKTERGRVGEPLSLPKSSPSVLMIIGIVLWILAIVVSVRVYQGAKMLPGGVVQRGGLIWGMKVILSNTSSLALIILLAIFTAYWTYSLISSYSVHFKRQWGWEDDLLDRVSK